MDSAFVAALDGVKADLRQDLQRHEDRDERDFEAVHGKLDDMTAEIQKLNSKMAQRDGELGVAKWMLNIGIPAILSLLVAYVVKHW